MIDAGNVMTLLFVDSAITIPLGGAAPERERVPETGLLPTTVGLDRLKELNVAELTVIVADSVEPFRVAVTVDTTLDETPLVVTAKVAVVAPAGIVTVAGTVTPEVDDRVIVDPPGTPKPFRLIVPIAVAPPTKVPGAIAKPASVGGITVRVAVSGLALPFAEIVAVVFAETAVVEIGNLSDLEPAGTVTVVGTMTALLFENIGMGDPPAGAGCASPSKANATLPL